MNWTIVIILGVIALVPTIYGMYLSRTPAFPDLMEPPEGHKGIWPPKVEDMRLRTPDLHFNDKVWATEGIHQGMYGYIRSGPSEEKYLVSFPEQGEKPHTSAWLERKHLTPLKPGQLPISPFTGEQYDPAWGTVIQKGPDPFGLKQIDRNKSDVSLNQLLLGMGENPVPGGGQSNRALLKLMKTIEAEQDPPQSVSGIIPWGQAAGDYPDPQASYEEMIISYPEGEREL